MDDEYSINCNQELKNEQVMIPSSLEEFQAKYYYKQDLVKKCRRLALPTSGTKAELNQYLTLYLSGIPSDQIKVQRKKIKQATLTYEKINLDTKVIGSGFSFNNDARQFFADYYGVKKFSFTKQMAIIRRQAEVVNNTKMTVGDLIKLATNLKPQQINQVVEQSTYQWNNFVRDFFNDEATSRYNNRLKVAALLWNQVRESRVSKIYVHALLAQYANLINKYKKHDKKF